MIETVMLIAFGFLGASLLALLAAPAVWRRAARLTTRSIEATMPISPNDIRADKDLLRAEYAIKIRRLELALEQEREKAARYRVERNKNDVTIGQMQAEIASLKAALSERANASTVLEQTVKRGIPELEGQLERARQIIAARDRELAEHARAFENQTEAVTLAKQLAERRAEEIERLRTALKEGAPAGGLWRRPKDRDEEIEDLNRERGRLEADLSRAREEIAWLKDRDAANADQLRAELHRLADRIMAGPRQAKKAEKAEKPDKAENKTDTADKAREPGSAPAQTAAGEAKRAGAAAARKDSKRTAAKSGSAKSGTAKAKTAKSGASKTAVRSGTSGKRGQKTDQPRKSLRERLAGLQRQENT